MKVRSLLRSFAGGEITPELFARLDLTKYQTGLALCLNFWTLPHGPAQNRPGFAYVLEARNSAQACWLIPFAYNTTQTFAVDFNGGFIRFHTAGGTLLETGQNITAITQANPAKITIAAHGYTTGQWVYLSGIGGMTALNGRFVKVTLVDANNFTLTALDDSNINSTAYSAFTSGGTAARVYEIASPYAAADLPDIHYTQSADVLTLVHPGYAPRELRRLGATNWTLTSISFVPTISAPTGIAVTASGTGTTAYRYKVTSVTQTGFEESTAGAPAISTSINITAITQANPAKITAAAHGLSVDDPVYIANVGGMTQIAGEYLVSTVVDANNINIKTLTGAVVDSTAFSAYTSGGTVSYAAIKNDLTTSPNKNTVTWTAVTGAIRYNVYKFQNGLFGYIGQTDGVTFTDNNIAPNVAQTPRLVNTPFTTDWPGAVGYFEQRRLFSGTSLFPQNTWMTVSGTESNLSYSLPTRDSDSITFRMASRDANTIRHIVPLSNLILLTSGGEWKVAPLNSDTLTPASASPRQEDSQGANNVQPLIIGKQVLYAQAVGCRVRQLSYTWQSQGYLSEDLSIMAPHLTDTYTIKDMAYRKAPYKMAWFVRSDGRLLGLTYLPEQQVTGWHQHNTLGNFESVCSVAEGSETALYVVVNRTINSRTVRYIERLASRVFATAADAFFVDSGVTYSGAPAATLSGLWHLVGQTVNVLGDAAVYPQQVVAADGSITLPHTVSKAQIGLPITGQFQTLPLAYETAGPDGGNGSMQNVNRVWLRLFQSSGVWVGPTFDKLYPLKQRTTEPYDSPPGLLTGSYEFVVEPKWGLQAAVCLQQPDPLPVTLLSATMEVAANV